MVSSMRASFSLQPANHFPMCSLKWNEQNTWLDRPNTLSKALWICMAPSAIKALGGLMNCTLLWVNSKSLVYETVSSCKHSPMAPIWEWKVLSTSVTFMTWYPYGVKPWMLSTISRSPNSPSTAFWDDHSIPRKLRVPSLKLSIMSNPGPPFLNSV